MKTLMFLCAIFLVGCSQTSQKEETKEASIISSIIKSLSPEEHEIIIVTSEVDTGDTYSYEGETYTATDEGTFLRVMSPWGLSANDASVNRKGIELDINKGKLSAGAGDLSFLDRLWFGIRNILVWLIGGVAILLACCWIPGPVGIFARGIFSSLPLVGGWYQSVTKGKNIKEIVQGGQSFKKDIKVSDNFTPAQKLKIQKMFTEAHEKEQDKATEAVVKNLKT